MLCDHISRRSAESGPSQCYFFFLLAQGLKLGFLGKCGAAAVILQVRVGCVVFQAVPAEALPAKQKSP